jgi:hypothetical protein
VRVRHWFGLSAVALCAAAMIVAVAGAEIVQKAGIRVHLDATLVPKRLPRQGTAPVTVSLAAKIAAAPGARAPLLRSVAIALNRNGRIDPNALPTCRLEEIQPATSADALAACGRSRVGEGDFAANVLLPEQSPYPSHGKLIAFNGVEDGRPVILAHVFGSKPIPTSFTLPFAIDRRNGGYVLSAKLPDQSSAVSYVTGISLRLGGRAPSGRAYLSAGCPLPKGLDTASFPLAHASFEFAGGKHLASTVVRSCEAVGDAQR